MTKELLPLFGEHLDRTISSKPSMDFPLSSVLNFTSKQPTLAVNPILKHAPEHLEAIAKAKANKNNSLLTSLIEISKEDLGFNLETANNQDLKLRAKNMKKVVTSPKSINKLNKPKPKFA